MFLTCIKGAISKSQVICPCSGDESQFHHGIDLEVMFVTGETESHHRRRVSSPPALPSLSFIATLDKAHDLSEVLLEALTLTLHGSSWLAIFLELSFSLQLP